MREGRDSRRGCRAASRTGARAPSWPPGQGPRPPGPVLDHVVLLLAPLLQLEDPLLQPVDHLPGDHDSQADRRGTTPWPPGPRPPPPRRARPGAGCPAHSLGVFAQPPARARSCRAVPPIRSPASLLDSKQGGRGAGGRGPAAPFHRGCHPREEGRDTASPQAPGTDAPSPAAQGSPTPSMCPRAA